MQEYLKGIIKTDTDDNKVTVIPAQCGTGKSTAVRCIIEDIVKSDATDGIMVITDTIKALQNYTELSEILKSYQHKIQVMTSENFVSAMQSQKYKPVLLLTTQRFFQMDRNTIINLLTWNNGKRTKIIFDERILTLEKFDIRLSDLLNVEAALNENLDNEVNADDKEFLIESWVQFKEQLQQSMKAMENSQDNFEYVTWFYESNPTLLNNDKFFRLVDRHKNKLNATNPNIYKLIYAIRQLIYEGATFTSQKKHNKQGEYNNYFSVMIDNKDKITNLGAKVFVLDGTGDIEPTYKVDFVDMANCNQFKRNLNNLTINFINIPKTGKTELIEANRTNKDHIKTICRYISDNAKSNEPIIFSYKNIEATIKSYLNNAVLEHFNNIKGKNDYRTATEIWQIGLLRYDNLYYKLVTAFVTAHNTKSNGTKIIGSNAVKRTMFNCLLVDLEQNIFRSAIRNADYTQEVTYNVLCNTNIYSKFIELVKNRYCPYGAIINLIDTPAEFQLQKILSRKTTEPTNAQKVLNWITKQPANKIFKISEMLTDIELEPKQFKKIKDNSPGIKELFQNMKTNKKGYYKIL